MPFFIKERNDSTNEGENIPLNLIMLDYGCQGGVCWLHLVDDLCEFTYGK